jgi:hypothetical protein
MSEYSWKRVELFGHEDPDMIHLNPALLDAAETTRCDLRKLRLRVIIFCVVCHELAHLLHFKIYNTTDERFQDGRSPLSHVEYGTELEYRAFGGRILSTPEFTALRVERRNGDVYKLNPWYFYQRLLAKGPHRCQLNFEEMRKVDADAHYTEEWMGMGEINGTHN